MVTFDPVGDHPNTGGRLHLLHGTLPGEVVCTENLTPLVKLLPCKGKTGISSLFDGHKLFDATWQTMSIDVQPLCPGSECVIEMDETIDMVLDIDRSKRPRGKLNSTNLNKLTKQITPFPSPSHQKNWNATSQRNIIQMIRAILSTTDETRVGVYLKYLAMKSPAPARLLEVTRGPYAFTFQIAVMYT